MLLRCLRVPTDSQQGERNLKVKIEFTVEVDQEAYADYYGIDNTAKAVRDDIQSLMSAPEQMAPHLYDEGIIQ